MAPPVNDNWADAILISGASGSTTGTNVDSTAEVGDPEYVGGGLTVWWKWVSPTTGYARFYETNALDTYFGVFIDDSATPTIGTLVEIAQDDDSGTGFASAVEFPVESGVTYWIHVDAYDPGAIEFSWEAVAAPANNNFAGC